MTAPAQVELQCGTYAELLNYCDTQVKSGRTIVAGPPPAPVGSPMFLGLRAPDGQVLWLAAKISALGESPPRFQIMFAPLDPGRLAYLEQIRAHLKQQRRSRKSLKLQADSSELLRNAEAALERGQFDDALRLFEALKRTTAPVTRIMTGQALALGLRAAKNNDLAQAAQYLREALTHDPKCARAMLKLRELERAQVPAR